MSYGRFSVPVGLHWTFRARNLKRRRVLADWFARLVAFRYRFVDMILFVWIQRHRTRVQIALRLLGRETCRQPLQALSWWVVAMALFSVVRIGAFLV